MRLRIAALSLLMLTAPLWAAINPIGGQANVIKRTVYAKADGSAITSGTVNLYVYATTGTNAGKWYKDSDDSWSAVEAVSKALTHVADGHWIGTVDAACWTDGVEYLVYHKESGDLHVPSSTQLRADATVSTRAPSSTALLNTTWTDTKAGYLDAAITSRHASGAAVAKSPATLAAADVSGVLPANMTQINGTSIAGTSTYVADRFKEFFNGATVNGFMNVGAVVGNVGGSVEGDVTGRVLGDSAVAFQGPGVYAYDHTGAAISTYAGGAVASVTGSVGSISGITFPTNFADLSITETTGLVTYANAAPPSAADNADAVFDEAIGTHEGWFSRLDGMLVADGGVYQWTANALELAPSGSLTAEAVAQQMFTAGMGTYAAAGVGSVVKEIADNAGGSSLSNEGIADAVWDELSTGHTSAGKAGAQLWTALNSLVSGAVSTVHSVTDDEGNISVISGDNYPGTTTVVLTSTGYTGVDPSGGTWAFETKTTAEYLGGTGTWTARGSVVMALSDGTLTATLTFVPADTSALVANETTPGYQYRVGGTSSAGTGSKKLTFFRGKLTIIP